MKYNNGSKGGMGRIASGGNRRKSSVSGGSMNLGGFGNKPSAGSTIPGGAKLKGAANCTGDAGRENDPNEGKQRRNPGNP